MKNKRFIGLILAAHVTLGAALLLSGCQTTKPGAKAGPKPGDNVALAQGTPRPVNPAFNTDLQPPTRPTETAPATTEEAGAVLEPVAPAVSVTYTVEKGDNLNRIAKKNNTTVAAIKEANGLTSDSIKVGQKLMMPATVAATGYDATAMAVEGGSSAGVGGAQEYTVQKGDSLSRIANIYSVSVADIKSANGLTSDNIKVGQKLVLPANASAPKYVAPVAPKHTVKASGLTYKVQKNDTIGGIAKRAGVKTSDLMALNDITDAKKLKVGSTLKLPAGAKKISVAKASKKASSNAAVSQASSEDMLPTNVLDNTSATTTTDTAPAPIAVQPAGSQSVPASGNNELENLDSEPATPTVPVQSEGATSTEAP